MKNIIDERSEMWCEYQVTIDNPDEFDPDFDRVFKYNKNTGELEYIGLKEFEEYYFDKFKFAYNEDINRYNPFLNWKENAFVVYFLNIADLKTELFKFFGFKKDDYETFNFAKIDTMSYLIYLQFEFNSQEKLKNLGKDSPILCLFRAAAEIGHYTRNLENVIRAFWIASAFFGRNEIISFSKKPLNQRLWPIGIDILNIIEFFHGDIEEIQKKIEEGKSKYYRKAGNVDISPTEEEKQILYEKKLILTLAKGKAGASESRR